MAANVFLGDVIHCQIISLMQSQLGICTINYVNIAQTGDITDQEIADDLSTLFAITFKPMLNENASYRGVRVQARGASGALKQPVFGINGQGQGGVAGDPLPKQTAGVISRKTERSGRQYQGRVYIPFPSEASNEATQGRPTAAYMALMTAFATDLYDSHNPVGAGGNCELQQSAFPGGFNSILSAWPYLSAVVRPYWGTQRRRGDFGPLNVSPI